MARQDINIGVEGNDGTGDSIRESFRKTNENFSELYAVFGIGGQIRLTSLSDTPDEYTNDAGKFLAVKQDETGVEALELASTGSITGDDFDDTIDFDYTSIPGKLILKTKNTKVSDDRFPRLSGPLDARGQFGIGNVQITDDAAQALKDRYGGDPTIDDLVIDKEYGDTNYLARGVPGKTANLRNEPTDITEYDYLIASLNGQDITIASHGLNRSSNTAPYIYRTTGTSANGLTNGDTYFIRVINNDKIQLYATEAEAIQGTLPLNVTGGTGTQTLTDAAYDGQLAGNWLDNEALPRKAVVRRQGDTMTGALQLHDHPGEFAGQGAVNGTDDLQAASKYYVDAQSYTSNTNIYVNNQGTDNQELIPPDKQGRSPAFAFKTINAACRKAEEVIAASPFEPGPYMQTITHSDQTFNTEVTSAGIDGIVSGRENVRDLIALNKEFLQAEVMAFIALNYPDLDYNTDLCFRDVGLMLDSISFDVQSGNNANYLSRWAGIRYYASPSARRAITVQRVETIAAIEHLKAITDSIIKSIDIIPLQTEFVQVSDAVTYPTDITAQQSVAGKFDVILDVIRDGVLNAPKVVDGALYRIDITNGNSGHVDQGDPANLDLLPGKVVRGKTSGALGRIINYKYEIDPTTDTPLGQDTLEMVLLEPKEFLEDEELEFGNTVRNAQVTVMIETGVYYEDYPIKVPDNVTIFGDEFRRSIIRPNRRTSQSPWANLYFYRDKAFDGLTGDSDSVTGFPDPNLPVAGTPYVNPLTDNIDGYFGYHYLVDPTRPQNVSNLAIANPGKFNQAAELISENRNFIVEEVIEFINANYPTLVYDRQKCRRDTGLILDAVALDVVLGTNYHAVTAGLAYQRGTSQYLQNNQQTATVQAIEYIKSQVLGLTAVSSDGDATVRATAAFDEILDILQNGTISTDDAADTVVYPNPVGVDGNKIAAKDQLIINRQFLADDVVAFVNNNNPPAGIDTAVCGRDTKYIVDGLVHDIIYGGTVATTGTASAYVDGVTPIVGVPDEVSATVAAFNHLISIASDVIQGNAVVPQTGNTTAQDVSGANATAAEVATLDTLVNLVIDVIQDGNTANLPSPTFPIVSWAAQGVQDARTAINDNRQTIIDATIIQIDTVITFQYDEGKCRRDTGFIVDALAHDLELGGREETLANQGAYAAGAIPNEQTDETEAAINHIKTIAASVLLNDPLNPYPATGSVAQQFEDNLTAETNALTNLNDLVDLITFAFDPDFNPPKNNLDLDAFMMNDATRISNVTVQGHGGFMVVLDPEGQILTKSPYIQVGSSFSQSINRQAFRGGMYIDAYTGNVPMEVYRKGDLPSGGTNNDPYYLFVRSNANEGLFYKKPQVPAPFYIDGRRFQVNMIRNWDPDLGTAELILDTSSNSGEGFTGVTSPSPQTGADLDSPSDANPVPITVQTAGNRSMLGNDFTQVNDLGYGLLAANGALSEMVSMFTYYCWTGFYAYNGAEIRSVTGSCCYGEYALVSEGSDPNEIPDAITLRDDMVMPFVTAEAAIILEFPSAISLVKDETVTQASTGATGTVSFDVEGTRVYLRSTTGTFNTTDTVTGSTSGAIGIPSQTANPGYENKVEQLSVYVYDLEHEMQNRGELEIAHPVTGLVGRYEVTNVTKIQNFIVDGYLTPTFATTTVGGSSAEFRVKKSRNRGYIVEFTNEGSGYLVGETFTIDGANLGGTSVTNDLVITIDEVSDTGNIVSTSLAGAIAPNASTPVFDGQVYKLNFTQGSSGFSEDGLEEDTPPGVVGQVRQNQTFVLEGISDPRTLVIRPSTAVLFLSDPTNTYRSIAFNKTESSGGALDDDEALTSFDSTFDYVRFIVESTKINDSDFAGTGTTMGGTIGDNVIAVQTLTDVDDLNRIANGDLLFAWGGKTYQVDSYTERDGGTYATIEISDKPNTDVNWPQTAAGLAQPVSVGVATITLRCGLPGGSDGTVTVNISTCRATAHDFLDIGTGGFNDSNYPNVLLGLPREPQQPNEVQERNKGRVFYVSTDQDGFFRVGRFFTVDQGTGTVTFSASIALSNLDGIGFKRGVVVSEFSTDTGMTNNAPDTVPTQSALRGYVNRRLGFNHAGDPVSNTIGPGVLATNGAIPFSGDLNAANNTITNVRDPLADSDIANKSYVDTLIAETNQIDLARNVEINSRDANQVLISTGKKRLFLDSATTGGVGTFSTSQNFTAYRDRGAPEEIITGAGTIVDVQDTTDTVEGGVLIITYTDTSAGGQTIQVDDEIVVAGAADGTVVVAPMDEYANGVNTAASDISFTTDRQELQTLLQTDIKSGVIDNDNVSATAAIAQSKLNMQAATSIGPISKSDVGWTPASAVQSDLGLAAFDEDDFTVTNGVVTLSPGGIDFADLPDVQQNTVLGRVAAGAGSVTELPLSNAGASDSVLLTQSDGSIRVNSLKLGGNDDYEILSLTGSRVDFKTPGQATILSAFGTDDTMSVEMPGSLDIGNTGTDESVLQNNSSFNGESRLAVDWIYSSFIEAPGEKLAASTGIAIGANTGKTGEGEVAIVVKNGTTASNVPALFNIDGIAPDTDILYSIGKSDARYTSVYTQMLSSGSDTDAGTIEGDWTLTAGSSFQATFADLAEWYAADAEYEAGTVVVFGGDEEITITNVKGDHRIAGVVSTDPAYLMNAGIECEHKTALALQGRVPCKVIGKVAKGDMLVTSAIPGYAIVNNTPGVGTVIGKAVGVKETPDHGTVEVLVGRV